MMYKAHTSLSHTRTPTYPHTRTLTHAHPGTPTHLHARARTHVQILVDWRAIPRARAVAHSEVIQVY